MTIIDSHAHLEPRMLDIPQMLARMDAAGVDKVALIPAMNDPLPHTPEKLLALIRRLMDSRFRPLAHLIHRATITSGGDLRLGGEVFKLYPMPDNQAVADILRAYPERFLGWIFLNPSRDPAALDTLERWRQVPGFIGVKLHPHWHDYNTDTLGPILARCEALGLPVLIHLGFGRRGDYRAMASSFPRLTIISAHAGFPFYSDLWAHKNDCPNLMVDLSSPYIDEGLARRAVAAMGPERCLYGTDAPYGFADEDHQYDYTHIRGWIDRMSITDVERERILGDNFARILLGARGR